MGGLKGAWRDRYKNVLTCMIVNINALIYIRLSLFTVAEMKM